jgi:hypothetical protein
MPDAYADFYPNPAREPSASMGRPQESAAALSEELSRARGQLELLKRHVAEKDQQIALLTKLLNTKNQEVMELAEKLQYGRASESDYDDEDDDYSHYGNAGEPQASRVQESRPKTSMKPSASEAANYLPKSRSPLPQFAPMDSWYPPSKEDAIPRGSDENREHARISDTEALAKFEEWIAPQRKPNAVEEAELGEEQDNGGEE